MFYSHEVLTSRKYGVATVWLVATLGSKSSLKKVSRKAILDVDVQKACETIVTPEAPMALRLQSNLLYGVTRVYQQQCGYVLNDAEAAKNSMRMLLKAMHSAAVDAVGGNKARADQIVLQDDPNFLPDIDLAPLDLERLNFDIDDSQRSTLSPHNSQLIQQGFGSQQDIGGILIPQSASSFVGGPVGGFGSLSIRGDSGTGTRRAVGGVLEDDLGLMIDDDGTLFMADAPARQPPGPSTRGERFDFGSASSRVRREHEEGLAARDTLGPPDEDGFVPLQDDFLLGPDAEPFPPRAGALDEEQQVTTEESAEAPIRRARPKPKVIALDRTMELRNGDLSRWNADYVANMNDAVRLKNAHKANALAKKNAEYWILGRGDPGPLSIFSGAKLLEALTGIKFGVAGEKRGRDEDDDTDTGRRVRSRGEPSSDELGRGFGDDGFLPIFGDDTIEQGREAPTPLDDRHMSSMMPWNQSTGSRRPTALFGAGVPTSASLPAVGAQPDLLARRGSRLTSASPLLGRGTETGGEIDDFHLPGSQGDLGMTGADEFELFGPAAQVDTQTAAQSQWQRAALDGESVHFLEFVQTGIEEMDQTRAQAGPGEEEDETLKGSVDFHELLPPDSHSRIVAAQALLHVLALGTKNLLAVEQEEAFGPITMRVVAT